LRIHPTVSLSLTVVALASSLSAHGCGAKTELPCGSPDCDIPASTDACDGAEEDRSPCEGTGRIWASLDDCIDDGGGADTGDLLEVYCVANIARFCLSHEDCPWRSGADVSDDKTCSHAGLTSSYMANTIRGCAGWESHRLYCCSPEGRMSFAGH
jgi:hypothetical protein